MLLTVMKHEGKWDFLAMMFKTKILTFERMVVAMLEIVSDFAYVRYAAQILERYTMQLLNERG